MFKRQNGSPSISKKRYSLAHSASLFQEIPVLFVPPISPCAWNPSFLLLFFFAPGTPLSFLLSFFPSDFGRDNPGIVRQLTMRTSYQS